MTAAWWARLVALAAIWGASFLFMRLIAPYLGGVGTAWARVAIAGIALLAWFRLTGFDARLRHHGRAYAMVGTVQSALPFALLGWAALHLPASLMSVLNSTAPMWGTVFGALLMGERLTLARASGLVLGSAGVALLARAELALGAPMALWAVAACLAATALYGITGWTMHRTGVGAAGGPEPRGLAAGSQLYSALILLPLLAFFPPAAMPTPPVWLAILAMGLLSSGVAYLLYFRLIADGGAARALTVTYLVPVFGTLWGALFLGEAVTPAMLAGAALILSGTALVARG